MSTNKYIIQPDLDISDPSQPHYTLVVSFDKNPKTKAIMRHGEQSIITTNLTAVMQMRDQYQNYYPHNDYFVCEIVPLTAGLYLNPKVAAIDVNN